MTKNINTAEYWNKIYKKMTKNINTAEYWNKIYKKEGINSWRKYPITNNIITFLVAGGKNIIELGCGAGNLTRQLRKNNHVLGIDISMRACDLTGAPTTCCSVPPINANNESFDLIVATEFLEHITDLNLMIAECARVAKETIFVVPNNVLGPNECEEHEHQFTKESITKLFKKYYVDVRTLEYVENFDKIKIPCILVYAYNIH